MYTGLLLVDFARRYYRLRGDCLMAVGYIRSLRIAPGEADMYGHPYIVQRLGQVAQGCWHLKILLTSATDSQECQRFNILQIA